VPTSASSVLVRGGCCGCGDWRAGSALPGGGEAGGDRAVMGPWGQVAGVQAVMCQPHSAATRESAQQS